MAKERFNATPNNNKKSEYKILRREHESVHRERYFNFIFTFERVCTCSRYRSQSSWTCTLHGMYWQPFLKSIRIYFIFHPVSQKRYDDFVSLRNWLFDLFITLFYSFRVVHCLNMMNVASISRCICNEVCVLWI